MSSTFRTRERTTDYSNGVVHVCYSFQNCNFNRAMSTRSVLLPDYAARLCPARSGNNMTKLPYPGWIPWGRRIPINHNSVFPGQTDIPMGPIGYGWHFLLFALITTRYRRSCLPYGRDGKPNLPTTDFLCLSIVLATNKLPFEFSNSPLHSRTLHRPVLFIERVCLYFGPLNVFSQVAVCYS